MDLKGYIYHRLLKGMFSQLVENAYTSFCVILLYMVSVIGIMNKKYTALQN